MKKETAVARRIVEEFTPDQCRCLYKEELFEVNAKHYKDIIEIAKDDSCTFAKHYQDIMEVVTDDSCTFAKHYKDIMEIVKDDSCTFAKHYKGIMEIVKDDSCTFKKHETSAHQYIKLSSAQVSKLRWLTISYLNMLESILVAWQYSVADRGIIEAQFSYLFDSSNCFATLTNFRMACGGDSSYPAIEVFAANVKKDKEKCLIEKGNVI